jgi:hypothetical protein
VTVVTDDGPDTAPPSADSRRSVLRLAAVLGVLGVALLATALVWQPATDAPRSRALYQFASEAWPLLVLASATLFGYETYLHRRLVAELIRFAGPRIVEALLPQETLHSFLANIYGPNEANRDVVAGVLGGEGRHPAGGDLAISTHTTVGYELQSLDHENYHLTSTISYSFRKNVTANRFVIFATCDALLRDLISSSCRLPLFDMWFVLDASLFEHSTDAVLPSVQIGISYRDKDDERREADLTPIRPQEVKFDRWPEYLTFFREATGPQPRLNARDHLSDLRIFEYDLRSIAHDEVRSIERLVVRLTTLQRTDDGFCYWQAPYPCYVERLTFDAKGLAADDRRPWEFRAVPFSFRSSTAHARWLPAEQLGDLDIRTWWLRGHGAALLWRAGDPAKNTIADSTTKRSGPA